MRPDDTLHLVTGGIDFQGWKSVRVRRSLQHCSGSFELAVSWRSGAYVDQQRIQPGEACEVMIGDDRVITGWVDSVEPELDAADHEVAVEGRDKTADLVDCSAVRKTGQWRGLKVEQIAAELAAPFGIRVRAEVDTGKPLPSFALQEGESVFEAADRAARIRGLLLTSDSAGDLVLTRAGQTRVATWLVMGVNVLRIRGRVDMRDRFSSYVFKGQAPGSDFFNAAAVSQIAAKASDPGVKRYRPLVMNTDVHDLAMTLRDRVLWEANLRAARSTTVEATVSGWRHADGLWQPNRLVRVVAPELLLDTELLVTDVEYSLDSKGAVTRLNLTRADAFAVLPLKATNDAGPFWALPDNKAKAK